MNNNEGQAAILIIFVIGMVGLLSGMSLTKTGFGASLMGRGTVNSTSAFYVANSGIEDALYKIQEQPEFSNSDDPYTITVGGGEAKVTVMGDSEEKEILSVGQYDNSVRKIRVTAYNTTIRPDFARIIQAGDGGIEIANNVKITGRDKETDIPFLVDIFSDSFVRGRNNGADGRTDCDEPTSTTQIYGNVFAQGSIEGLDGGSGPCIDGNVYAGSIDRCRVYGTAHSVDGIINDIDCPYGGLCDPATDIYNCNPPMERPLPDIGVELIETFLTNNGDYYLGNCVIGESDPPCWSVGEDGIPIIGNLIIDGDLRTLSNSTLYLSGPVWVRGDVNFRSNQVISLDPAMSSGTSLIILSDGKIVSESNVNFTSDGSSFLLLASKYTNNLPDICDDESENAININSNVQSILFYAINGCARVEPSAGKVFWGAVLAKGIKIENNVEMAYDPALRDAEFFLREEGGWQISAFTEE